MKAELSQDRAAPETWRVEREHENGGIELAIFSGPNARERAIRYVDRQYGGDFIEVTYPAVLAAHCRW